MINVYNQFDALSVIESLGKHFSDAKIATLEDYFKSGNSLLRRRKANESISDIINNTDSKSTFYKRINSIRYFLCKTIKDLLDLFYETEYDNFLIEASGFFHELQEIANFTRSPDKKFEKTKSKRTALRGLPADWMEQVANDNPDSKYRLPLLTMALTGCRPAELVKGIEVSITKNDISFFIMGSKVSHEKGQPFRTISYPQNSFSPLIGMLKNTIGDSADKFMVSIEKAVNLTVEVRRISKKLWPNHKESITCYCFRHQFSADMKKSKKGDDVSRALGHATDKTRKMYGHASQSRGLITEVTVTVPRPIRNTATRTLEPSSSPS